MYYVVVKSSFNIDLFFCVACLTVFVNCFNTQFTICLDVVVVCYGGVESSGWTCFVG